jgi:hypothetical protein
VPFAIELERFDIAQSGALRRVEREAKDRRRDIGREHLALRASPARRCERLLPRAGRHIEDPFSRADRGHVQHGLGRRS